MAYLTKWGGLSGLLPKVSGRLFFVAPSSSYNLFGRTYSASNDNRGEDPDKALLTVTQALSNASDGYDDAIILLPGAHTVTASLAVSKSRLTIMGLEGAKRMNPMAQKTSLTTSASDEIANVTASHVEIANLALIPVTTKAGIDFSAAATGLYVHDCAIDMYTPAVNTGTQGIAATGAADGVLIEHVRVLSDGAQGAAVVMGAVTNACLEDCTFENNAGTWAAAVTVAGAGAKSIYIRRNAFYCSGTAMTAGISGADLTAANGVFIHDNRAGSLVTKLVDDFGAADAEISENYDFGVGATDGGVLVTVIT